MMALLPRSWTLHLSCVLLWVLLTAQDGPIFQPSCVAPLPPHALLCYSNDDIPCLHVNFHVPRNTPKTFGSGSHLCHIGKWFLCGLCARVPEIREEVVWNVLEAGERGKQVRKGGETMPHSTLQHHAQQFQHRQRIHSKLTCPTGVTRPRQGILACAKF